MDRLPCERIVRHLADLGAPHAAMAIARGRPAEQWSPSEWGQHLAEERRYLVPMLPERVRLRLERSRRAVELELLLTGSVVRSQSILHAHCALEEMLLEQRDAPSQRTCIYLDHNATTPVDPRVLRAMDAAAIDYGNPHSADHTYGDTAKSMCERARAEVSELLGCAPSEVHFTSGATESIRLAVAHAVAAARERRGGSPARVLALPIEHRAMLTALGGEERAGRATVRWLAVDDRGRIVSRSLVDGLAWPPDIVVCMAANNEIGNVYPIAAIGAATSRLGARLIVDATQAAGKLPLSAADANVDYTMMSAHKIYGPKGVGALVVRAKEPFEEPGGTPNVAGIVGLGEACRLRRIEMDADEHRIAALRDRMERALRASGLAVTVNGALDAQLAGTLHISLPDVPSDALLAVLRDRVALSTGAACASGRGAASHVLAAMGLPMALRDGAVRIGLGKFTTAKDVDDASRLIIDAARRLRDGAFAGA